MAAANVMQTADERRKKVLLGDLPADFLRLGPSSSQEVSDEQAARALQDRYNARAAGVPQGIPVGYASAFVPPNTRGRLNITISEAKLSKNYGLVRMDPYCRVRVGNGVFETPTAHNGAKNPIWNRTVVCYLPNGVDSIYLEIFDERAFTTDERIAWGHIVVPEAVINGDTIEDWYCLSGQQGEGKEGMINLTMALSPVEAGQSFGYVPMTSPVVIIPGYGPPGGVAVNPAGAGGVPPQQQPHGPMYTDADVKEINEMFPNVDEGVIRSVLDEKRGNKDATVNALLSITADEQPPPVNGPVATG